MPVNTASLKTFAPVMRRQLLEAVGRKLDLLLHSQTPDTLSTYARQIAELREQEAENRDQLLERVAYTWFNRLCALRYLDARGWHPFGCKVLMPGGEGETQPELLKLMRAGSLPAELQAHTKESRLHGLLDGKIPTAIKGTDPQGEVYRELVLASCRSYHHLLPSLFEALDDSTELLLPDDLLTDGSIAGGFRQEISDEDCQDVEIIGWLYQFYISEKKEQVIGSVVNSEDIPAATQLFTPNWIVKYMLHNSLGAQWLATYPQSQLKDHMEYYIEPAVQTAEVMEQLGDITPGQLNPEDLTLIDPASGSGHILVEAYELLKFIYLERGYRQQDIPQLILKNNLFGLDIDERAAQLTSLALMMKGRADDRRLFERGLKLNVMALVDGRKFEVEELAKGAELSDYGLKPSDITELKRLFEYATTFGSLIQLPVGFAEKLPALKQLSEVPRQSLFASEGINRFGQLVRQAEILATKYDVVVANPPYMGGKGMNSTVKAFVKTEYPDGKSDLFACFIERGYALAKRTGYNSMVTMESWMFLSSYEKFRIQLLKQHTLKNLAHFPYDGKQPTVMGINFGIAVSIGQNIHITGYKGHFCCSRYSELDNKGLPFEFPTPNDRLKTATTDGFTRIPGCPIAYWVGERALQQFSGNKLADSGSTRRGLQTGDKDRFIRNWQECDVGKIERRYLSKCEAADSGSTWFYFNNGGDYRKWYGNLELVVHWKGDGALLKSFSGSIIPSEELYFQYGVCWSRLTSGAISFREHPFGVIPGDLSPCYYTDTQHDFALAYLNTPCSRFFISIINPTMTTPVGDVAKIPFKIGITGRAQAIQNKRLLVERHREDWDAYERSWNFQSFPLLTCSSESALTIESSYTAWLTQNLKTIAEVKHLEEENNSLFIHAYGLDGDLTHEIASEQITLTVNPAYRYAGNLTEDEMLARFRRDTMGELLSYATGCMMGRYSLDQPGLILADSRPSQTEQLVAYEVKVGKPIAEVQYKPDPDAIIPVLDGEWFEDDIVARTLEFIEVTFPESTVTQNLRFIEESLGKDIRKYFCSEFYKDHLQAYKKRPIYWMVQSPKKGFACLIYLHRYTKDTLNQVLNNYFRPYLQKLEARLAQLGLDQLNDSLPARERTAARKEAERITKVLKECQAWEQDALLPLAQQRIELDLDDGVKVNQLKLQDVLAPIPGLGSKDV